MKLNLFFICLSISLQKVILKCPKYECTEKLPYNTCWINNTHSSEYLMRKCPDNFGCDNYGTCYNITELKNKEKSHRKNML